MSLDSSSNSTVELLRKELTYGFLSCNCGNIIDLLSQTRREIFPVLIQAFSRNYKKAYTLMQRDGYVDASFLKKIPLLFIRKV